MLEKIKCKLHGHDWEMHIVKNHKNKMARHKYVCERCGKEKYLRGR